MISVRFPPHLVRHYPVPLRCAAEGETVRDVLCDLEQQFPGLTAYLIDERGALRQHVNIFLGDQLIRDRTALSDPIAGHDEVVVMQALSGG